MRIKFIAVNVRRLTMNAKVIALFICLSIAVQGYAQRTPREVAEWLGVGWNLGNQMDAHQRGVSNETCWGNGKATPALFDSLRAVGVRSVRIPVTWMGHIGEAPGYEIEKEWMSRVKEIALDAHKAGLNVIVNLHHDGADRGNWLNVSKAAKDEDAKRLLLNEFTAVWRQIATEFKSEGDWLILEPFNELHDGKWGWGENQTDGGAQYRVVNELNQTFVDVVRSTGGKNRKRWLAAIGYCTNIGLTIDNLVLPKDKAKNRLMVGVHCYDPYLYTLEAKYNEWGGAEDEQKLEKELRRIHDAYVAKGIPVYIGEMGCVRRAEPNAEAVRLHYLDCYSKFCGQLSLPFFYWDNGSRSAGRECSGLLDHATGRWHHDGKQVMQTMVKGF